MMTEEERKEIQKLISRAKKGEFEAFDELVSRFERQVYSHVYRILRHQEDAEDAVQETFLSVARNISKFRGESAFYTWLIKIATNFALKILRKRKKMKTVSFETPRMDYDDGPLPPQNTIADWKDTPEIIAGKKETGRILNETLEELDEKYRLVFILRDVEGISVKETAQTLNISESNVKVRLMRARLMLREKLTKIFQDEKTKIPGSWNPQKIF